ncbi:trypsin-like peptidase domain-containing protein [bacterium]|nr:trypsin-like peptidase domain-containing protein [bacterium]
MSQSVSLIPNVNEKPGHNDSFIEMGIGKKAMDGVSFGSFPVEAPSLNSRQKMNTLFNNGTSDCEIAFRGDDRKIVKTKVTINSSDPARAVDAQIKGALAKVIPATVFVKVVGESGRWSGSGAIVNPDDIIPGYTSDNPSGWLDQMFGNKTYFILTNHHVANDAKTITITTVDGEKYEVEVVTSKGGSPLMDKEGDVAVLKFKTAKTFQTAKLIGRNKRYEIGDTVMAVGYPFGLPKVVATTGRISQPAQQTGESLLAIQSTAAINPGNSGGPLVDLDGEILGLNTYSFRGADDTAFTQPVWALMDIVREIYKNDEKTRGNLGMDFKPLSEIDIAMAEGLPPDVTGAKVSWVDAGSYADDLGIMPGDIITYIKTSNGEKMDVDITSYYQLTLLNMFIHNLIPGEEIEIGVYRRYIDEEEDVSYEFNRVHIQADRLSERLELYSDDLGIFFEKDPDGSIVISSVDGLSPAGDAGVEDGKWKLVGVSVPGLLDSAKVIKDLDSLKEILIELRTSKKREIFLYTERIDKSESEDDKKVFKLDLSNLYSEQIVDMRLYMNMFLPEILKDKYINV